jgi:OmpA-OmpF porin, OOP family
MKWFKVVSIVFTVLLLKVQVYGQSQFNRFSFEANVGFNHPIAPLSPGYRVPTFNFGHLELSGRHMFNEKFGLIGTLGTGQFNEKKGSPDFLTDYVNVSFSSIINWGRIMSFESFTRKFTILSETGFGLGAINQSKRIASILDGGNTPDYDSDYVYNFVGKLRLLYFLNPKMSLQGVFGTTINGRQRYTFDGNQFNQKGIPSQPELPFIHAMGVWSSVSLGMNFYIGNFENHADWYIKDDQYLTKSGLNLTISEISDFLRDSDGDGVPDYSDQESNSDSNARVSALGVSMDSDSDGTLDHLDNCPFIPGPSSTFGCPVEKTENSVDYFKKAIHEGYLTVYFSFDSFEPSNFSLTTIKMVGEILVSNPTWKLRVNGYADEIGPDGYNFSLSEKRAKEIVNRLISYGVESNRITYTGHGEDKSISKVSKEGLDLARRVSFEIVD